MSHVYEGPLATYNSLTDPNLSGYFGNTRMRRHLRKSGLVNRQGFIISENQYRINMARKEHKKHVKDLLAQAIVHKTLDLERYRQVEIKKKLEEIAKIELVRRVRNTRGRKGDEEVLPYLTPRSQSRPQSERPSESSSTRKRPKSAPAPPRHRTHSKGGYNEPYEDVIYVDGDGRPVSPPPASDRSRQSVKDVNDPIDTRHLYALDSEALQQYALKLSKMQKSRDGAMSPYLLSQIPKPPKKERVQSGRSPRRSARMSAKPEGPSKERRSGRVRSASKDRQHKDPDTVEGALMLHRQEPAMMHQGEVQTLCEITMKYHGPNLTLPRDQFDPTQEVCIEQQHCGGNTLPVFKERLQAGSSFAFISRRHRGYPFSLTLYIDGRVDCRVSTCCEYKHGVGVKLGGKMGHFSLTGITGATPCYKCKLSVQAPPRSLKLKKSPKLKKKREPQTEEVTVEGTPRTPVTEKEPEVSDKSDDDYEDDFEDEGNKYEDDFETEEEDRRQIIGLRDDETRENGKTVVIDVKEKEKEEEREGTLPPHRRIEGYSSEDEDQDSARFNAIKIKADIHSEKKEQPARKQGSPTSSSSSASSTPRAAPQEESKRVALVRRDEEPMRSDRTDHSTTSTTSGDLTTATESTVEAESKRPASTSATKKARRNSSSSSSSSTTSSSDSEDERFSRKKRDEKKKQEEEKKKREDKVREIERRRKVEEDERKRKEQEERDLVRRKQLEEEEIIRKREDEERRQKMEEERQQRNAKMKEIEAERRRRDAELQRKKEEEERRKEEEKQKRANEEERIKKDYERQLSQIKLQRESSSNLIIPALEENEGKDKTAETKVEVPKSSSSSDSSSEDEEKEKKPLTDASPVSQSTPAPKKELSSSSSSSSDTTSGSESEREKEKPTPTPMKPIEEETEKKRKSSTSSSGSSSSSSNGEYTVQETQKREEDKKTESLPPPAIKKSSSSSSSSSDSESEEDNKKVKTPPSFTKESEVQKDSQSASVGIKKESNSGSISSGSSSTESEAEPPSPKQTERKEQLPPDLQAGLKRNEEPIKESALHQDRHQEEKKDVSESEDSSSDSSSTDSSDSSDSETETVEKEKPQTTPTKSTDSEGKPMHGGNDPDNVTKEKGESSESVVKVPVAQAHYGSILPMVENESSMELSGVKLDQNQIAELSNHLGQRSDIVGLTLRNCALDDDNFQNMALALRTSPSHPKIINLSNNKLGRRSISTLASAIKEKPTVEILILNSNPVENVGCKILIDAILKAKDPFPFLRRSSGYLTPSEARDQESEGKDVYAEDNQADSIIKELDLGQTGLSDAGIMEISRLLINNKTLTSLNLAGNTDITTAGWERLGQALQKNNTLKTLSLDFTNLGDEGIENLVKGLRFNTSLKCLDVASCGLGEKGGKALQMLVKENTSITELTIQPGNFISDAAKEEICQFLALNKC